jgi:hypothetical protein
MTVSRREEEDDGLLGLQFGPRLRVMVYFFNRSSDVQPGPL